MTGALLTLLAILLYPSTNKVENDDDSEKVTKEETVIKEEKADEGKDKMQEGVTFFDEPEDIVQEESFRVFQVVNSNFALANAQDKTFSFEEYEELSYTGAVYALYNEDNKDYSNDEIVKVPHGKEIKQLGTYRYIAPNETFKTVPVIMIVDK